MEGRGRAGGSEGKEKLTASRVARDGADEGLLRTIDEPIALVAYDPAWTALFEAERERLLALFPETFIDIVHIGSTAVPGLCAKPIVDLLAGVRSMDEAIALDGPLCANGYTTSGEFNASLKDRQYFMRHELGRRTHHLHVVVYEAEGWRVRVAFRDRLRDDTELQHRYSALKADLAKRFANDREAYTDGKSSFIAATMNASCE